MALDRQIFQNSSGQRKKKGSVGLETKTYLVARVPGDRQGHFCLLTGHKVLPEREEDNPGLSESTVFTSLPGQCKLSGIEGSAWQGNGRTGSRKAAAENTGAQLGRSQGPGEEGDKLRLRHSCRTSVFSLGWNPCLLYLQGALQGTQCLASDKCPRNVGVSYY